MILCQSISSYHRSANLSEDLWRWCHNSCVISKDNKKTYLVSCTYIKYRYVSIYDIHIVKHSRSLLVYYICKQSKMCMSIKKKTSFIPWGIYTYFNWLYQENYTCDVYTNLETLLVHSKGRFLKYPFVFLFNGIVFRALTTEWQIERHVQVWSNTLQCLFNVV